MYSVIAVTVQQSQFQSGLSMFHAVRSRSALDFTLQKYLGQKLRPVHVSLFCTRVALITLSFSQFCERKTLLIKIYNMYYLLDFCYLSY